MLRHILTYICLLCLLSCNKQSKPQEEHLSISFTGDVLLDRGVRQQIEKKGIDYLLEDVAPIFKSSDATIINLECPITDTISPINKRYIFRANTEWTPHLRKNGITHATLANNHSMDQGRKGLIEANRQLQKNNIVPLGYGTTQNESCEPVFISKDSIEVAVFASVFVPLENWVCLDDEPGICQANAESISERTRELKKMKPSCYVVVVLHWGSEYQQQPSIAQRKDGRLLIDAGADAVIGHHPHVIQKKEMYKGKPIFYSLGNFVFDQNKPETSKSMIAKLLFYKNRIEYEILPITIKECRPTI